MGAPDRDHAQCSRSCSAPPRCAALTLGLPLQVLAFLYRASSMHRRNNIAGLGPVNGVPGAPCRVRMSGVA